ncbi:hypothetical protein JCM13580A_14980 [Streptomyces drozdowiczii]
MAGGAEAAAGEGEPGTPPASASEGCRAGSTGESVTSGDPFGARGKVGRTVYQKVTGAKGVTSFWYMESL